MKIQLNKIQAPLPDGTNKLSENVFLKETMDDGRVKLDIYVPSKTDANAYYDFAVEPDKNMGSLSDVINELMRQMYTGELELSDDMKSDVMRSVTIGVGELAAGSDENTENKIFYHMLNGMVVVSDIAQIDWDSNIKNIENIQRTTDNIRHLITSLMTTKEIEAKTVDENGTETTVMKDVSDVVKNEIAAFSQKTGLNVDYSMFEKSGIATEREILIAKLVDILEIHQQIIAVTMSIKAQRDIINQFTAQQGTEPAHEIPVDEIPEVSAEEVEEVPTENNEG